MLRTHSSGSVVPSRDAEDDIAGGRERLVHLLFGVAQVEVPVAHTTGLRGGGKKRSDARVRCQSRSH